MKGNKKLKIGLVGLGDIALKAYLPVIAKKNVEVHLHTRNEEKLVEIGEMYRYKHLHGSLDSLIDSQVTGVFVHSNTLSHYTVVKKLLSHNIHVYVDKPLTNNYNSSMELVGLAESKSLSLMVGFNRRYAPAYRKALDMRNRNMLIMQKNRKGLPGEVRTFIFDDFIHVIDTLLFLIPSEIEQMNVTGRKVDGLLHHVVVHFTGKGGINAIGVMNRDSGTVEERIEVFSPEEKYVVNDLINEVSYRSNKEIRSSPGDWQSVLFNRGFEQIVDYFLAAIQSDNPFTKSDDILQTHRFCEEIVQRLELIS
jgi:virulence factor